jgi:3-oxoacyl-[acyl-carrier protein] reductase
MDLGLKGKVAMVTGVGSQKGYGKGIALVLAEEGCDLVLCDVDIEGANQTAAEVKALGRKALACKVDVTNSSEVNAAVKKALDEFGRIDILVNNAGAMTPHKLFVEKTESEWDRDIDINLRGVMYCTRAVMDQMIARRSGKIVNITSIGLRKSNPCGSVYNAAKGAVAALSRVLAVELAQHGINVNCVAPGMGLTNFAGGNPPKGVIDSIKERIPAQRATEPRDIGNAVAFLASDVSNDIIGQSLGVDGGESIT